MSYGKRAIIAWALLSGQGETSAKELDMALLRGGHVNLMIDSMESLKSFFLQCDSFICSTNDTLQYVYVFVK